MLPDGRVVVECLTGEQVGDSRLHYFNWGNLFSPRDTDHSWPRIAWLVFRRPEDLPSGDLEVFDTDMEMFDAARLDSWEYVSG